MTSHVICSWIDGVHIHMGHQEKNPIDPTVDIWQNHQRVPWPSSPTLLLGLHQEHLHTYLGSLFVKTCPCWVCCLDVIAQWKQETQVGPGWNLAWLYQWDILKSARNPLPNPFNRGVHYNNVLVLRRCHLGPCWCRPCRFPTRRWWPPNSAQSWRTTARCPPGPRQRSPGTTGA